MDLELEVHLCGEKEGWRVVYDGGCFAPNPEVKAGDKITWKAPDDRDLRVFIMDNHPFK